jgi:predicted ribosome quality control (RQC) complex YloA/Tae2 family protein
MFGANVNNTAWIGNIYGVNTQNATTAPVIVSADGQLGTVASSERFKKDIATMEKTSEAILSLRPVTFHYKTDIKGTPQFGLIAEEVAKVNPALVLPDRDGKPFTVRYDAVNAMLLNEFLKEHRKVENLKNDFQATVAQQQKEIEALTATVKEQAAQIQKVSAQLEASKPAPQVVNNP